MRTYGIIGLLVAISIFMGDFIQAAPLVKGQKVRVMPVGDSITLGKGSSGGGYRKVLYEWLISHGYAITYVGKQNIYLNTTCSDGSIPYHEGYGSFRAAMILNGGTAEKQTAPPLKTTLENFKPDVVLLMIGTNDIIQNLQLDTLEDQLNQILDTIYAANSKTIVLVASIAPITRPSWLDKETHIETYNAAIPGILAKQETLGHQAVFVDVHAALQGGGMGGDGVHPNNMGYAKMAQAWYKALTGEDAPAIDLKNPLLLSPSLPAAAPSLNPPVPAGH